MRSSQAQQLGWRGFIACQAGDPEFDFARGTVRASIAPPLKLAFEALDLRQPWPAGICIEHFTGGDDSGLNPSMSLVDFLGAEKIGLDFTEAWFGIFGSKEGLNVFIQLRLVFLDGEHVLALRFQNLSCQASLGVHGICGNHFL